MNLDERRTDTSQTHSKLNENIKKAIWVNKNHLALALIAIANCDENKKSWRYKFQIIKVGFKVYLSLVHRAAATTRNCVCNILQVLRYIYIVVSGLNLKHVVRIQFSLWTCGEHVYHWKLYTTFTKKICFFCIFRLTSNENFIK